MGILRSIFQELSHWAYALNQSFGPYTTTATFRANDQTQAMRLRTWQRNRAEAVSEIQKYVQDHFDYSLLKIDCPLFKIDEDGRLHSVLYNGRQPQGWRGIPHTHWMIPEDPAVAREVNALPAAPPLRDLHAMIGWPYINPADWPASQADAVQMINHMVRVHSDESGTYVTVPRPENFKKTPAIQAAIADWRNPPWLVPVVSHRISLIKNPARQM